MEKNYTVDWFSGNIQNWDSIFDHYKFKNKENLCFLEIGCFEGRATNYLLDNILTHETSKIHVVDTFAGSRDEAGMNWDENYDFDALYNIFVNNINEYKNKVVIHRGLSGEILKKDFEKNTFDFIYIDGSHTAYDVLQDAILCHSLLKSGGIMIFDDYGWKDPNNLHPTNSPELGINCFMLTHDNMYDCIMRGYQVGLIKK
jgi:SAM-dependent methyltransferase